MARESYQEQLDQLRSDVLYMGELVGDRLRTALSAMESKDDTAAMNVIEGDAEINQLYLDLEGDCVDLLALQQPVASDLRFIAASFKIITDLERIGDLATNLADYSLDAERDVFPEVDIQSIGDETLDMLETAMEAFETEDHDTCLAIADRDEEVDEMCRKASEAVVRDLMERNISNGTDDAEIEQLMNDVSRLLLTIRDLERVGDHATNIAARTLYMSEGDDQLIY
ncbi:phosphate transport system regulatory protein PhoU [Halodesulfurarchaeum formicicum]|uniref:Phosphate-specific transport system accessory protein PhoU n=1 Tax=Halodesulfurarchaeum formicicum TaxID=1873524 RepID=A0A1D8S551_9EURY|nr:phosphate signaling complex protein PhoU [Halodesulfurarchaeum formicicum]AOW80488.1 phosphate transport system regulatory protein PhoU [Halodesulfurarchaeum formicicum]APE95827.1 phosphate transport system regulatory protein PhoU [Halodesulfurarchaeum formicicum]